jgi:DNA (cytosine-5)-methyltransferase 1
MKTIKVGSDFSGVGAFNQALTRLGIEYQEVYACDMDKYARQTFIHNYGEPKYYPLNVYDREIPSESLDIYMTSPPCQAFSMAGKRLGKEDKRGILFFNSLKFIQVNNPRFFIFENVRGLLSHDKENKKDKIGKTFKEWIDYLGGKSINGVINEHSIDGAVPYHLHYKVLNAKKHGVPQNRERVFLIGIRDDQDNTFTWPAEEELTKRLKNVLEPTVDDKYFLSNERINYLVRHQVNKNILIDDIPNESKTCIASYYKQPRDCQYLKIKSGTAKGYDEATEGDSINLSFPGSETRRGRVGKQVAQTLDTACNQGVMIGAFRGRNPNNASDRTTGAPTEQRLEINQQGTSNAITTVQKDNVVVQLNPSLESGGQQPYQQNRIFDINGISPAILANLGGDRNHNINDYRIRRLTPRECFRLMDFPDTFSWPVSDSQAYKQAGNSIVVRVLEKIIKNLPL